MSDTSPITLTGHDDDVITLELADGSSDDLDAYNGTEVIISDPETDEALLVRCEYTEHGTWTLAPTMLSDAHAFPDWDIVIAAGHDYSPSLTVHAPEGATVTSAG